MDGVDSGASFGFSFVDIGRTLRATDGDSTSNKLSFDITALSGSPLVIGGKLAVDTGNITADGSYANVYADPFDPSFTTCLGNMTAYCDGPACANGAVSSALSFAGNSAISVVAGLDVSAAAGGVARINDLSFLVLTPVPEPSSLSLVALGLAAVAWRRGKGGRSRPV